MQLPTKAPGKRYVFDLYWRRGDDFPIQLPDLGDTCVCCDRDPDDRRQALDISGKYRPGAALPVPVCEDCAAHALDQPGSVILPTGVIMAALIAAVAGIAQARWLLAAIGGAVAMAAVLWLVLLVRRVRPTPGHSRGLSIQLGPQGRVTLWTTNPRLARHIAEHAGDLIRRAY
jgi:hypothetical protein